MRARAKEGWRGRDRGRESARTHERSSERNERRETCEKRAELPVRARLYTPPGNAQLRRASRATPIRRHFRPIIQADNHHPQVRFVCSSQRNVLPTQIELL